MMKIPAFSIFFLFLILLNTPVLAQGALKNQDLAYKYDPYREVGFDYHVVESEDSFHLYFSLDFVKPVDLDKDFHIFYELRKNYSDKGAGAAITLTMEKNCINHDYSSYLFYTSIPRDSGNNLLLFHIVKKGGEYHYLYDVPLNLSLLSSNPSIPFHYSTLTLFSSTHVPVIRSFLHTGDSVFIHSGNPAVHEVYVYWYKHNFEPADPPMSLINKKVGKELNYDSLFEIDTGKVFTFPGRGLYFIQSDTSSTTGITIRCQEGHYPKLVLMEDIFEPIIYMSTEDELNTLKNSSDKRKTFESYWLKIAKTQERARKIIRGYYDNIEEADNFFTSYKEGWKTDMGMIYIFFGAPDAVYNNGLTEKWLYGKKGNYPSAIFIFDRLLNVFSSKSYILERNENYRSLWFQRIDRWRKGAL